MPALTPTTRGILWMIVACTGFAALWVCIRYASRDLHPFTVVVARNGFGLLWLTPMLLSNPGLLDRRRMPFHLRRATSGVIATSATFYAVAHLPLATALSINYTAPLFATIGAVLFLGERLHARRVVAVTAGFAGMLIVLRPGMVPFSPGIAAAIIAAMATAFTIVAIRQLVGGDDARAVAAWSFVLTLPVSIVIAAPFLTWPQPETWLLLVVLGGFAAGAQYALTQALSFAEASAVMPYDFVRFGLVITAGIVLFGERADVWTLAGGTVILSSTVYLAIREGQLARAHRAVVPVTGTSDS